MCRQSLYAQMGSTRVGIIRMCGVLLPYLFCETACEVIGNPTIASSVAIAEAEDFEVDYGEALDEPEPEAPQQHRQRVVIKGLSASEEEATVSVKSRIRKRHQRRTTSLLGPLRL